MIYNMRGRKNAIPVSEDKEHTVNDVALAATIGADDTGEAFVEGAEN